MRNKSDRNPNFLTKFLWFCSGANIQVLERVESEQSKYANQGFAIFIIGIVGACTGGYAISTVFTSRLVIYAGGATWGLILSSIDRSMISGFNKTTNPSFKERFGGFVSLVVKLGISTLISFSVAKPLELKIFESSIEARIAINTEEEIDTYSQPIIDNYELEIQKLEEEKKQHLEGLTKFQQQLEQSEDAYQEELLQGGFGRDRGYGSVARQLEQSVEKAQQQYNRQEQTLRPLIKDKDEKITALKVERNEKLEEIEREVKEEKTATDFVARIEVLHEIQAEEAKIFWIFGVYGATGWAISLIFILIDTYPVINKIFAPINNYEKLLEKYQQEEDEYAKLVLSEESKLQKEEFKGEITLTRELEQGRAENERELIPERLVNDKSQQQKKIAVQNDLISQGITDYHDFSKSYSDKCRQIGLEELENADSLAKLRQVKRDFSRTYRHSSFSPEERLKINLFSQDKTNRNHSRDRSKSSHQSIGDCPSSEESESEPASNKYFGFLSSNSKKLRSETKRKSHLITKAFGLLVTPLALWVGAETLVVSKIKIDPIPYPQEVSPNLVYTSDGEEIRDPKSWKTSARELDIKDFSPILQQALIASEDRRFYRHNGVDLLGILRALVRTAAGNKQGGSTISQQVAKKLFIEQQADLAPLRKKVQQIILAIRLESNYDKAEILQAYLNRIYLGHQQGGALIGFEEAAQFYFDKSARDLNISESAILVGMLPNPNISNPIKNIELAKKMRDSRIQQMLDLDIITQEQAEQALKSEITVKPQSRSYPDTLAPYVYNRVRQELAAVMGEEGAESGQFIIETTLNSNYQQLAEQTLKTKLQAQGADKGYNEGALVTIDNQTGAILALVGGTGANYPIDFATDIRLSIASTFKLIPYTVAIAEGISPNRSLSCADWQGKDGYTIPACHQGDRNLTLAASLAHSENPPALRLAEEVGLDKIEYLSQELGLDLKLENMQDNQGYHQQLVLGTYGSTVLKITNAYATIANNGTLNQPHLIKTIRDRHNCVNPEQFKSCAVVYSALENFQGRSVVDPRVSQEVTTMLRGVVTEGTAFPAINNYAPELISNYDTVGKTGTSRGNQDIWFVGSVPQENLTTGVWLGQNCVDEPIRQKFCPSTTGDSSLSVALWANYMKQALY